MNERVEAPTDAQLEYINDLCAERGIPLPDAIHSKTEASEIISSIRTRTYDPRRHRPLPDERGWPEDSQELDERARYESQRYGWDEDVPF
jgi:hypothetical protein